MSVFKRGGVYWYKFWFLGQPIRESAKTDSKTLAKDAEHARRRDLERQYNRIPKREQIPLLSLAAQRWLDGKAGLAPHSVRRYRNCVAALKREFGGRLVCDITHVDIAAYQRKRLSAGKSPRSVNYEVGALRGILKQHGLWSPIADRVRVLRESHDVGKAISAEDETKLMQAAKQSRSPALLPLMVLSLDTGLRAAEVQGLRRSDLHLCWSEGLIASGELVVPKSKTDAGTGRAIPLTRRTCAVLTLWLSRFPKGGPESYLFPFHRVGFGGNKREPQLWNVNLNRPMGSWRSAWTVACKTAGLLKPSPESEKESRQKPVQDWRVRTKYRWHDLRHTFVSRLAESPTVSEETIKALAGHVSKRMLERYSHIRLGAKRAAIATLEQSQPNAESLMPETPVTGRA